MPRLSLAVCCQSSSIDSRTNSVSLFHLLEQVQCSEFPAVFPFLEVVTQWDREGDQVEGFTLRTRFLDPQGQQLGITESPVQMDQRRHRLLQRINGIPFPAPGTYSFEVSIQPPGQRDWTVAASIPLIVERGAPAPQ